MAQLFVLSGVDAGRSFVVKSGARIGRGKDCEVRLRDTTISRKHAHVEERDGRWSVVDDGSRNGILVESERRDRLELADHDEFRLGEMLLRFRLEDPVTEAPKVEGPPPKPAPVAAAPVAPAPAAAQEPDEIVLEGGGEEIEPGRPPAPAPWPARAPAPPVAPPAELTKTRAARPAQAGAAGGLEAKSRVLQYHRTENRRGAMVTDVTQYPLWLRWLVYALAIALAVGIAYLAFRGTSSLREGMGLITLPPRP